MARQIISGPAPNDYESLTVSSTAVALTEAKAQLAQEAIVSVETDQVRYRLDGTAPTSSEGHLLEAGDYLVLRGYGQVNSFQAIRVTTDATLRVTYLN